MYQFQFEGPKPAEIEDEIVMHNLKEADKAHNLKYFMMSATGWFQLLQNKNANHYDFELFLRKNNFDTHLFAYERQLPDGMYLIYPNTKKEDEINKKIKYECFYSCRPPPHASKEVLSNWKSHENNLNALRISGMVVVDDMTNFKQSDNDVALTDKELDKSGLLSKNKIKLFATFVQSEIVIFQIVESIKREQSVDPDHRLIAMNYDGSPIIGLFVGDTLMSETGYMVSHDQNGHNFMSIVKLGSK
uniref:Uncharacterized protein n=1 Tax=Marseillevirus LCMAC101 TaxID=2506602 RepID=A0A481YRK4_9VIRU|nr:MAG: hypothetical protein LCMAC101_04170 [Marseillevirus LCMAC101]